MKDMKNKKMKLHLMKFVCWFMTVILIAVIGFQIWFTYNNWNDLGTFAAVLYIVFQAMVLLYATANVVVAWNGYFYERWLYKKDSKNLYHI